MARCYNTTANKYNRYGGRGICVCKKWHFFGNFSLDMFDSFILHAESHNGDTQLDRINNDGDYTPENCRWLTRLENIIGVKEAKRRGNQKRRYVITTISFLSRKELEDAKKKARDNGKSLSQMIRDFFQSID